MEPDLGPALRPDVVGALVEDTKTHILQDRHPLGERNRPALAEYFQPHARRLRAALAVKVDAQRPLRGEQLKDANVADRNRRRIDFAIVDRASLAIALEQHAPAQRGGAGGKRLT